MLADFLNRLLAASGDFTCLDPNLLLHARQQLGKLFGLRRRSRIETSGSLELVQIIELREPLALVGPFFRKGIVDILERGLRRRKLEGSQIVEDGCHRLLTNDLQALW